MDRVLEEDRVLPRAAGRPLQASSTRRYTAEGQLRGMEYDQELQPASDGAPPHPCCQGDEVVQHLCDGGFLYCFGV